MNATTKTTRYYSAEDYTAPEYSPSIEKSGYAYKLPADWRYSLPVDCVMWFSNDATSFFVVPTAADILEMTIEHEIEFGSTWWCVCCPLEPSAVSQGRTNMYWQGVKAGKPVRTQPTIGDYLRLGNNSKLPELYEWLNATRFPLASKETELVDRYCPQWRVLRSLPDSLDLTAGFTRWAIEEMISRQLPWGRFCEAITRQFHATQQSGDSK